MHETIVEWPLIFGGRTRCATEITPRLSEIEGLCFFFGGIAEVAAWTDSHEAIFVAAFVAELVCFQ